ncbi:MAG: hypothetical protein ACKV2V_20860 [Blastocatellia bacterium]
MASSEKGNAGTNVSKPARRQSDVIVAATIARSGGNSREVVFRRKMDGHWRRLAGRRGDSGAEFCVIKDLFPGVAGKGQQDGG